jgi:predicted transcriptional regulator of viral defense system
MQTKPSTKLSSFEGRILSWAQMTGTLCADNKKIGDALRFQPVQCQNILSKMSRRGLIVQLQRGLYLLPEKLPPGGVWQPPADTAVWFFLTAKKASWQETGAAAFNYYGLSEQVANQTVIYNDKISATRKIGCLRIVFIKVPGLRLGGVVELDSPADAKIKRRVGSLARVVLDAVYDYSRFGTLPRAYRWIEERKADKKFLKELVRLSLRYGNIASLRRIGWFLERLDVSYSIYAPLLKGLKASKSFIPADPTSPKKGRTNPRWAIVENLHF